MLIDFFGQHTRTQTHPVANWKPEFMSECKCKNPFSYLGKEEGRGASINHPVGNRGRSHEFKIPTGARLGFGFSFFFTYLFVK